jgi:cytochrome c peroxidase
MAATTERRLVRLLLLAVLPWAFVDGCGNAFEPERGDDPYFTASEWEKILTLSPLPDPPSDPTNRWADDAMAAALGKQLFFDEGYGWKDAQRTEHSSCAKCHIPVPAFVTQNEPLAEFRNITSALNVAYYEWYTWDGRFDSLWSLPLGATEGFLNSTRLEVAHRIAEAYAEDYTEIFGDDIERFRAILENEPERLPPRARPTTDEKHEELQNAWEAMRREDQELADRIFANFGKALAAYMRRLVSRDADFDRYVAGDYDAIDTDAKRGLRLFIGHANCISCHEGPAMTDNEFHNVGVPLSMNSKGKREQGRYDAIEEYGRDRTEFNIDGVHSDHPTDRHAGLVAVDADRGAFRTPTLRDVEKTAPFMHAGQIRDLQQVIEHYNEPPDHVMFGVLDEKLLPLKLTIDDIDDLEALMITFTGETLDSSLLRR